MRWSSLSSFALILTCQSITACVSCSGMLSLFRLYSVRADTSELIGISDLLQNSACLFLCLQFGTSVLLQFSEIVQNMIFVGIMRVQGMPVCLLSLPLHCKERHNEFLESEVLSDFVFPFTTLPACAPLSFAKISCWDLACTISEIDFRIVNQAEQGRIPVLTEFSTLRMLGSIFAKLTIEAEFIHGSGKCLHTEVISELFP